MAWTRRARHDRPVYISRTALPVAVGRTLRELVSVREAPEEALRLLEEYEEEAPPSLRPRLEFLLPSLRGEIREQRADGAVWIGPKDDGVALAVWRASPGTGRRIVHLYFAEGYRNSGALARFLELIDAELSVGGRVAALPEEVPGLPPSLLSGALPSRGFRRYVRLAMRRATRPLPEDPGNPLGAAPVTAPRDSELEELLRLYVDAFTGSIDRLWLESGDLHEDARATLDGLRQGTFGAWLKDASFVAREAEGALLGASLVTQPPGRCPLLLALYVKREAQGHGLGRRLLVSTLGALAAQGHDELELNVVQENLPAYRLYRDLGFRIVEGTEGAFWSREGPAA